MIIQYPSSLKFIVDKRIAHSSSRSTNVHLHSSYCIIKVKKGWKQICTPSDTGHSMKVYRFASTPFLSVADKQKYVRRLGYIEMKLPVLLNKMFDYKFIAF